ncbi:MAG: hypothetical protein ACFFDT_13985 [Candidatus Hodarchaeota archaeon]
MVNTVKTLIIVFILGFLLFPVFTNRKEMFYPSYADEWDSNHSISSDQIVKVTISITAPNGHEYPPLTPIIIKLSELAFSFPPAIDPFGFDTSDASDDIKWDVAYVFHAGSLIPSQVDDTDDFEGFSGDDELVFVLPKTVDLAGGETTTFSVFLGLNPTELSAPKFPEVCTLSVYPDIAKINTDLPGMLAEDGVYYIGNKKLRAAVLQAAAWSSGGLYHIQLLNKDGESRWDAVKQKFPYPSEVWKWSRVTIIEQFISQNQAPNIYAGIVTKMISGPIRAQIQVQSTQTYTYDGTMFNGLYGLFTYDLYADQTYLDYTLDLVGESTPYYPELVLEFQNREWGGDRPGTLYTGIYIPGVGWIERGPDNTSVQKVDASKFADSWYLEALLEGTEVRPSSWHEPEEDPYRGYGFIFDHTGFSNITWTTTSESLTSMYAAAQFPFKTRYLPFDKFILGTRDKDAYMTEKYQEWLRPDLITDFSSTLSTLDEIPEYTYYPETTLEVTYKSSQLTEDTSRPSSETSQMKPGLPGLTTFAMYPVIVMVCLLAGILRKKTN